MNLLELHVGGPTNVQKRLSRGNQVVVLDFGARWFVMSVA